MPFKQQPFFVYGTLLPNQPNFFLWETDIAQMEPATFYGGKLYDMGYYPMLVAAKKPNAVQGMLVTVKPDQYAAVRQRLDALEGYDPDEPEAPGYQRRTAEVLLEDGRSRKAWIYLGQPDLVVDKPDVPDGDWVAYAAQVQPDLQEWWNTIQSVAGLHKPK